jgi:hypothetical protein
MKDTKMKSAWKRFRLYRTNEIMDDAMLASEELDAIGSAKKC